MVLIKTLFYTGVRVSELVAIRLDEVDIERCQIRITRSMSPHKWRHFLFTWLKKEGIDDALIQPYSGHATRQSLEIYSRLSLTDAQPSYNQAMERFPIQ